MGRGTPAMDTGGTLSQAGVMGGIEPDKGKTQMSVSTPRDCKRHVTSCLTFLPLDLSFYDRRHPQTLSQNKPFLPLAASCQAIDHKNR